MTWSYVRIVLIIYNNINTLSNSGMSNSTSSNISNNQITKSQSWRTLVININSAPGKRVELENLINYTDPTIGNTYI